MPEFGLAGAETMCENLTYELIGRGNEVVVISLYNYHSPITNRLENANVKVYYLNKKNGLDISMISKLVSVFKTEKPYVIHTHRYVMQYAIPASVICGIKKRIHTVHNVAEKEVGTLAKISAYFFYKYFSVIPVALSSEIKKTITDLYRIKDSKVPVIFNGVNLVKCEVKKNFKIEHEFKILHVGRFTEQKNHERLINTFEQFVADFPNAELYLIGEGHLENKIKEMVSNKKLSKKVNFVGTTDNVYPYYSDCDVFVLPSDYEGIPMTLIEAMGSGIPIIATNVGGVPDMIVNMKEGILIDCDMNSLFVALTTLYKNEELREQLGKNALAKSKEFSSSNMAIYYERLYEGLDI